MAGLVGEVAYWTRLFYFSSSKNGPSGFVRRGENSRTLHFNPTLEKYRSLVNNLCHSCHMYVTY